MLRQLKLRLNPKVYQLSLAHKKLHMLGIEFWPDGHRLDGRMRGRIKTRLNHENYASYRAMMGEQRRKLSIFGVGLT